jgi:hypothetical protein
MYDPVEALIELYPDFADLCEALDIEPATVIEVLLDGGYVVLPPFLELDDDDINRDEREEA